MPNPRALRRASGAAALCLSATAVAVIPPGSASAASECAGGGPSYVVVAGDSWYSVAASADVTPATLTAANAATLDVPLHPGQSICLPSGADPICSGSTYTVQRGDSWFMIASRLGVAVSDLAAVNGATFDRPLFAGDELCAPPGAGSGSASGSASGSSSSAATGEEYTVRSGDSWYAIAARADVAPGALLAVNDSRSSTTLLPGQTIVLPAGATMPSAPPSYLATSPVSGRCWTADTWHQARSGGRTHQGVDLIAATGTEVRAVAAGTLVRWQWDQTGLRAGNAWYLRGDDGTVYFYAHMSGFANGLRPGSRVAPGDVLGTVGATGNAVFPHLHLEIRPGGGAAIDPYPYVAAISGCGRAIGG